CSLVNAPSFLNPKEKFLQSMDLEISVLRRHFNFLMSVTEFFGACYILFLMQIVRLYFVHSHSHSH
ncbi:MAG: hypothetical protein PHT57_13800, partial [Rhodoferax sp.]|nr:hypothetical protein [Rhodoferax sp.]